MKSRTRTGEIPALCPLEFSMRLCPYCGQANDDLAVQCRKCDGPFVRQKLTAESLPRSLTAKPPQGSWASTEKGRALRQKALSVLVLGLMIKVYWGGYGPWPVIDYPPFAGIRPWLEPLLLYGGAAGYLLGWVLRYI